MNMTEKYIDQLRARAQERRAKTYHGHAQGDLGDMSGGRYGALPKPIVVGVDPVVRVPQQPAGSPWAQDECPPEPLIDRSEDGSQLGYAIDGSENEPPSTSSDGV